MAKTFTTADLDAVEKRTYTSVELDAMAAPVGPTDAEILAAASRALAPASKPEAPRPGPVRRLAADVWNAGPAAILRGIRENPEGLGGLSRDAAALTQFREARKTGEELTAEEAYKRADVILAERAKKPFLVGGTAGQVLAGNQLPLPPAKGFLEKAIDVGGGVGGAVANIALTRKVMPTAPEALVWEIATEAAGGKPGTGAAMAGIMGAAGKIIGKAPVAEGIGKRVLRRAEKAGLESVGFGAMAAAEGASPEEIATQMLIPVAFGVMGAVKELPAKARRQKLTELVRKVAELDKTVPPEAVKAAEKIIESGAYDKPVVTTQKESAQEYPQTVYHATKNTFEGLPTEQSARTEYFEEGEPAGIFYSNTPEKAQGATGLGRGQRVIPAKVTAKNIFIVDERTADAYRDKERRVIEQWVEEARQTLGKDIDAFVERDKTGRINNFTGSKTWKGKEQGLPDWSIAERLAEEYRKAGYDAIYDSRKGDFIVLDSGAVRPVVAQETPKSEPQETLPVSGEPQPPASEPFSIRNAAVAEGRARVGLPPREPGEPQSFHQWRQEAIDQGIPERAPQIAAEIVQNPRPMTPQESQGFEIRMGQILDTYDKLAEVKDRMLAGSPELKSTLDTMQTRQEEYRLLADATEKAGTPASYALASRKALRRMQADDTNLLAVVDRAEIAKGDKLTPVEHNEVEAKVKVVKEGTVKVAAARHTQNRMSAVRSIRLGKRRYRGMTEAEKDAEVQDTLSRPIDDRTIKQLVENFASRSDAGDFDKVVGRMQRLVPDITIESVADSIVNATAHKRRTTDALVETINEIASRQPRRNNKLRTDIEDFRYYIDRGEAKEPTRRTPKTETEANQKLIEIRDQVRAEYNKSDAVAKQRLEKQLALLDARIANKDYGPRTKIEKPVRSPEVEHLAYEVAKRRQELNQHMMKFRSPPKTWQGKLVHQYLPIIPKSLRVVQAWKSSVDLPLLRQGGIAFRSHPLRTIRRVPEAIEAMFNPEKAWQLNNEIVSGENSWWYHRAGLDFGKLNGLLTEREEVFASEWAERIPGIGRVVRASDRGFVTLLNMVRADSFDAMTRGFTKDGGSLSEARAIAAYVNVMTGRGSIKTITEHAPILNGILWSPKFAASRFQYLIGMPLWQAPTWRTRGIILQEYGRYLAGMAATTWLYENVFGGKSETDPRSTHFGQQRVGDVWLDPWSGLGQSAVFLTRELSGQSKTASGRVMSLNAGSPEHGFGDPTRITVAERYLRGKLAYAPGIFWDRAVGSDFTGQPFSWKHKLLGMAVPMSMEELLKVMEDQGTLKGLAIQTLSSFSEGVQVNQEKERGLVRQGPVRQLIRRGTP